MAPLPPQWSQQVSVESLWLRVKGDDEISGPVIRHRLRSERRGGANMLLVNVGVAAVVLTGCLTAFAVTSKPQPSEYASAHPGLSMTLTGRATAPAPTSPAATRSASTSVIPSASASQVPVPRPPRTASPPPVFTTPAPPRGIACTVRFTITDSWPGGFTAYAGITNTGGSPLSPWTLVWTFTAGQQITHGWDGEYSQAGSRVTVYPASYNPTIAPSGTVNTGFNASHAATNPSPTGFAVNGTPCARTY